MSSILEQLASELARYKTTGTPSEPYYTGPASLFGVAGLERDIISTRVQPTGFASTLPAVGTVVTNPLFPYITGPTSDTGSDPSGVCGHCKEAGHMKSCLQTAQFGRYCRETRELNATRIGQQTNRGEFQDIRVINGPLLTDANSIITPNVQGNPSLFNEVFMRFVEVGISFQNLLGRQFYIGNPANNNAGGGYREFPGADILIGTNKVDAITGAECPGLDSDVKNFNYQKVEDGDIVRVLTYMTRYIKHVAEGTLLNPCTWKFVMRESLFYEITAVWPCSYLTYRCSFRASDGTQVLNVNAADQVAMRDEMRRGKYLLIDGEQWPVVFDSFIPEETNTDNSSVPSGCFASDIYLFPMTVLGGILSTYWEYLDYSKGAMIGLQDGQYAPNDFWTDGGRFLWHKQPPTQWCIKFSAVTEPRLIIRTPQIAARLTNVVYCPLQHTRDAHPDDPYFVNGGVSTDRPGPSLYSDWNLPR